MVCCPAPPCNQRKVPPFYPPAHPLYFGKDWTKLAHTAGASLPEIIPVSVACVLLLPSSPLPQHFVTGTHLYFWVLSKNTTKWLHPALEPRPLDPASNVLTIRPPRLTHNNLNSAHIIPYHSFCQQDDIHKAQWPLTHVCSKTVDWFVNMYWWSEDW